MDVEPVINAVGYATRVGGSRPSAAVLEAMAHANRFCFEIDDLQAAASSLIADLTGAEAGIITCGAAAALTVGAAACLAGNDPQIMDELPDTSARHRREIIYPRLGPYDYDHAVRLSGAKLVEVEYDAPEALTLIARAISDRTSAVGYVWLRTGQKPTLPEVVALANRHGVPVLVDAALSLPPTDHLRQFIAEGADLVTFSGGKHLGGPQASGLLMGKRDLIRSAWVQMVDMDVRPETWSLQAWIDEGWMTRAPRHGIGRSMKVGKEAILGLMAALREYPQRDHAAERDAWARRMRRVAEGLSDIAGLRRRFRDGAPNGQPFPCVELRGDAKRMQQLLCNLRAHPPRVVLAEDETDPGLALIFPMCLTDDDAGVLIERFHTAAENLT